jgi:hypothetical protein
MPAINVNGISGLGTELIIVNNPTGKIQPLAYTAHTLPGCLKQIKALKALICFARTKFCPRRFLLIKQPAF